MCTTTNSHFHWAFNQNLHWKLGQQALSVGLFFQTKAKHFSFLSRKIKRFIPKKICSKLSSLNRPRKFQQMALAVPIFREGFAFNLLKVIDIAGQGLDLKFSWTAIMSLSFWPILTSRWIFHNDCGTLMKHQILSCKKFEILFSILNCFFHWIGEILNY